MAIYLWKINKEDATMMRDTPENQALLARVNAIKAGETMLLSDAEFTLLQDWVFVYKPDRPAATITVAVG